MSLHYVVGGKDIHGEPRTPYILTGRWRPTQFVIYCRTCHRGLSRNVDIGSVVMGNKIHNVIAVEPCQDCLDDSYRQTDPVPVEYPAEYVQALEAA